MQKPLCIVLKLGTSSIIDECSYEPRLPELVRFVQVTAKLRKEGYRVAIISSGAVGIASCYAKEPYDQKTSKKGPPLAAIGQGLLTSLWQRLFTQFDQPIAQILLTRSDISDRTRYLNVQKTFKRLLDMGVIPIINENDPVAIGDAKFGNNDELAAVAAGIIQADYLLLFTDVDCLFDRNPRLHSDAKPIEVVRNAHQVPADTTSEGSSLGTGGMSTKIKAAQIAASAGIPTIITSSSQTPYIQPILESTEKRKEFQVDLAAQQNNANFSRSFEVPLHTCFLPKEPFVDCQYFWLIHGLVPHGSIYIRREAMNHLVQQLDISMIEVEDCKGKFSEKESVVIILIKEGSYLEVGRALINYSVREIKRFRRSLDQRRTSASRDHNRVAVSRSNVFLFPEHQDLV